ncbi:MAG: hypothetical protein JRH07_18935 [Deltaproteobacteria bacterium]|nr:hypothetical protein [Deltaproteobacteria bacterium]
MVLSKYGTVIDHAIPSAVNSGSFTLPTTGEGALDQDAEVGFIVQAAKEFASSLGENSQLGIKAQLERPAGVTGLSASDGGSQTIDMTCTASTDTVVTKYDVYVLKDSQLAVPGVAPTTIEPNTVPSKEDLTAAQVASVTGIDKYFDLTNLELTAIAAADYWVIVVAKDGAGMADVNESALVVSSKVTVA